MIRTIEDHIGRHTGRYITLFMAVILSLFVAGVASMDDIDSGPATYKAWVNATHQTISYEDWRQLRRAGIIKSLTVKQN